MHEPCNRYPLLVGQLLHNALQASPDQTITYRDRVTLSYRDLRLRIGRLAAALAALGVRPGSTVAMMDYDSHRYLEAFFAVPMMGAVLHTVNVRLAPDEILYTINHAEDDVVLVHRDFLPVLERIAERIARPVAFVLLADEPGAAETTVPLAGEYEALLAAAEPDFAFPDLDENATATTFYTTGTTGLPKGVMFSHRQLVLHTLAGGLGFAASAAGPRLHREDVYMPLTPMFHVHAWGLPYMATLLGLKQVYPGKFDPAVACALIGRHRVSFTHGVPAIAQALLSHPKAAETDFSGMTMVVGGSALPTSLAQKALERGIQIVTGYGMSETCPLLTLAWPTQDELALPVDQQAALRTRTGKPFPLVRLAVVDEAMAAQPQDATSLGEVVAQSPWLTARYAKDDKASAALWAGGWLHTGDIGHVCPRGYLVITDRLKDVIKSGGEWISSLQLEDLISRHPSVAEAAVVGAPDPRWGEAAVAYVVCRPEAAPVTQEAIAAHLAQFVKLGLLPRWAAPRDVHCVEAIPRTSVGKINKRALRAEAQAPAPATA